MINTPKIGLVTVLYNSNKVLPDFFHSLALQTYLNYNLFIIDNSPTQESENIVQELIGKYTIKNSHYVKNEDNVGVAKGNNQGIILAQKAGCEYILLLNNDIVYDDPDLLINLVGKAMELKEHMVVPKILFFDTHKIWLAGGKMLNFKVAVEHIGYQLEDSDHFNRPGHFDYAPTCFMLIHKSVFDSVGLMDEKYFVYYDDTDFVKRAMDKGYKIYYEPKCQILHKESSSTGGNESVFSSYYFSRNRVYFLRKHYTSWKKLFSALFLSVYFLRRMTNAEPSIRKSIKNGVMAGLGMEITRDK